MESEHALVADAEASGLRLDVWLARRLPSLSRARLQGLITDGHVVVDGAASRTSARLRPGQSVVVRVPAPAPATPEPEDIPLAIVYEDPHLLVVDKPAGVVVHPGAGTRSGTLVNALLSHVRDLSGIGGVTHDSASRPSHMLSNASRESLSWGRAVRTTSKYRLARPPRSGVGSARRELTSPFASRRRSAM